MPHIVIFTRELAWVSIKIICICKNLFQFFLNFQMNFFIFKKVTPTSMSTIYVSCVPLPFVHPCSILWDASLSCSIFYEIVTMFCAFSFVHVLCIFYDASLSLYIKYFLRNYMHNQLPPSRLIVRLWWQCGKKIIWLPTNVMITLFLIFICLQNTIF
jgi:hypothetical protein